MSHPSPFEALRRALRARYEAREADTIARWFFEDALGIRQPGQALGLSAAQAERLAAGQARLLAGEPLQYVSGWADFYGLRLRVGPGVLIPRAETEELVHEALASRRRWAAPRILDLGTGSGCIALALARHWPGAEVHALDISAEALAIARANAEALGLPIHFWQMDALDPAQWAALPSFDLIVSNPPYIATAERRLMPEHVLAHEPALALFAEGDALGFYRALAGLAAQKLAPGGRLLAELNEFRAEATLALWQAEGLPARLIKDMQGKWRMISSGA